jgi:dTDP-4-dehydrorhamnose reductase
MKIAILGISGILESKMLETFRTAGLDVIGFTYSEFDAENPDKNKILWQNGGYSQIP